MIEMIILLQQETLFNTNIQMNIKTKKKIHINKTNKKRNQQNDTIKKKEIQTN